MEQMPMPQAQIEHLMAVRMIKCFAKGLDTHSSFFSPEEAYEMRLSLEKQFDGVGVVLAEGIDGVMIAELIEGSPAAQSEKIHVNDYLVAIDGQSTQNKTFEEVLDMLKRKDRGELILGFKRVVNNGQEMFFRVPLAKRPIVMNEQRIQTSVEKVEGGIIGKISLHSFYETSDGQTSERDIKEAIRSFQAQGELKGLVLDLRENSGGFLSQAVKVTGLFVSNGVAVISKYGTGEVHYLRNVAGKAFYNGPLVVLTSKMSASAAEIVAQALQDYGVALVVGDERTFGKGSIQFQTVTDDRAEYFFKVTVGRYYTVSGKSTQIEGVAADIVVPTPYAPYNIGERYLEYPLQPDRVSAAYNDPLTDLDEKTQYIFQKRYLPFLQRVVSFWKKNLPELRRQSAERLAKNPAFQQFLKKQEMIRAQANKLPVNSIDENFQSNGPDFQMQEAVSIVKDMIQLEALHGSQSVVFQATGTEGN
jgi:carboxyl-terminal processing protease